MLAISIPLDDNGAEVRIMWGLMGAKNGLEHASLSRSAIEGVYRPSHCERLPLASRHFASLVHDRTPGVLPHTTGINGSRTQPSHWTTRHGTRREEKREDHG